MTIGLIGEGITDQITVEHILISYTEDKNLSVNQLQPLPGASGNWDQVFKYCKSEGFKQAFQYNDFVAIQIDTDFLRGDSVPEEYRIPGIEQMEPTEIVERVKTKLIECFDTEFYEEYKDRIIFAIAVDQTECWFLAVYFPNDKKKASKYTNCLETLNSVLKEREGFYIDAKKDDYYRKMCKHFRKKKDLLMHSKHNDSFRIFIEELDVKLSAKEEDAEVADSE
ncbi:hypothetical protein ACTHGU_12890 [Chitinophagaceae bacterium MMS25-I14]